MRLRKLWQPRVQRSSQTKGNSLHMPSVRLSNSTARRSFPQLSGFSVHNTKNFIQNGCSLNKRVLRLIERKKTNRVPRPSNETRSAEERPQPGEEQESRERRHGFDLTEPCDQER
ncbi:hypothetical protein PBY51_010938 [Eleginops maclovinus]|uniref:Uncharacterized protein n=1 Tax=Eleginops maclovinus TaxID=56733 RepID=A0AAN8AK05_ELEMC|nr:hypothetical protein PBY51_010938 [Eleginops maclovinus]